MIRASFITGNINDEVVTGDVNLATPFCFIGHLSISECVSREIAGHDLPGFSRVVGITFLSAYMCTHD